MTESEQELRKRLRRLPDEPRIVITGNHVTPWHTLQLVDDELPAYWRLAARPHLGSACPFDLILHESAAFDVTIGPETYDGLPVSDLALFGPLLAAIAEGKVITRTWSTVGTGQVRRVETIVQPNGCEMWRQVRDEPAFAAVPLEACVRHDRHYTPFTRAGAASA